MQTSDSFFSTLGFVTTLPNECYLVCSFLGSAMKTILPQSRLHHLSCAFCVPVKKARRNRAKVEAESICRLKAWGRREILNGNHVRSSALVCTGGLRQPNIIDSRLQSVLNVEQVGQIYLLEQTLPLLEKSA